MPKNNAPSNISSAMVYVILIHCNRPNSYTSVSCVAILLKMLKVNQPVLYYKVHDTPNTPYWQHNRCNQLMTRILISYKNDVNRSFNHPPQPVAVILDAFLHVGLTTQSGNWSPSKTIDYSRLQTSCNWWQWRLHPVQVKHPTKG